MKKENRIVESFDGYFKNKLNENEDSKFSTDEIVTLWDEVYGENMEEKYEGFYRALDDDYNGRASKEEIVTLWDQIYGENLREEYEAFYKSISGRPQRPGETNKSYTWFEAFTRIPTDTSFNRGQYTYDGKDIESVDFLGKIRLEVYIDDHNVENVNVDYMTLSNDCPIEKDGIPVLWENLQYQKEDLGYTFRGKEVESLSYSGWIEAEILMYGGEEVIKDIYLDNLKEDSMIVEN